MALPKFARLRAAYLFAWPCRVFLLIVLTSLPSAHAQSDAVRSACDAAQKTVVPPADLPDSSAVLALQGCDAETLYYGYDKAPDFRRARQCAYLERTAKDGGGAFGGAAILAMIYANGLGVARNLRLALKFSCEGGWAGAEIDGRYAHLAALARAPGKTRFDWCDDISSGYMMGFCADRDERFKTARRERRLAALVGGWSAAQQRAWVPLQAAARHFFALRARAETEQDGTDRGAEAVNEAGRLNDEFVGELAELEHGKLPSYSHDAFIEADRQLNRLYARALTACDKAPAMAAVSAGDLRNTQRAWLRYRDAWVGFGAQAYPGVSADSWRAWSTEQRIRQLSDFIDLLGQLTHDER